MKTLQNFVNGKKVSASSDKVQDLINPATGQVFAKAPVSNAADVDKAMKAAASAFEIWKESTPGERQKAINKIADAIEDRSEELIGIESENTGKPIAVTRAEEIGPMLDQIRFFAGAARNLEGKSAYIGKNVVLMPSFVNVGAYVDDGTMIDTWSTVGSCAQIGKNCHISGGVGIGGVLEPLQANPVIIEDNCFIGARSEVAEGVIVGEGSVISMGVYIGASTKIIDRKTNQII